jgi:hypothetical protein
MTDLEKRRSDVSYWSRRYEKERTKYALSRLKSVQDSLRLAEIDEENKRLIHHGERS